MKLGFIDQRSTFIVALLIGISISNIRCQDEAINITLSHVPLPNHSELYGQIHAIQNIKNFVINGINIQTKFIIFQVHSQIYPLKLSSNDESINGTNVGIYSHTMKSLSFSVSNPNMLQVNAYISIHGYSDFDPIPGGCNMEFPLPVSPFLKVQETVAMVTVEASPANSLFFLNCQQELKNITYSLYRLYLNEKDFTEESYFKNIAKMVNIDSIENIGTEIPLNAGYAPLRHRFSAYMGIGSIYVFIVSTDFGKAVYVPSASYACDLRNSLIPCEYHGDGVSKFLLILVSLMGLFMAYYGHKFFKTEMFLVGFTVGVLLSHMLLPELLYSGWADDILWPSIICGACFGLLWLVFWCFFGSPVLSSLLPTLLLGFLIASVVFYSLPAGIEMFEYPASGWMMFVSFILLVQAALACYTLHANMLACAIIGSYVAICCYDTLLGSYLKFIIINTVRRATVPGFSYAAAQPPYQHWDIYLTILWVSISLTGFLFQIWSRGAQPPFPPPPRFRRRNFNEEYEPLLQSDIRAGIINTASNRIRDSFRNFTGQTATSQAVASQTVSDSASQTNPMMVNQRFYPNNVDNMLIGATYGSTVYGI